MWTVDLTDEQLDRFLVELSMRGFGHPYMARVANYPDPAELQEADRQAEQSNRDALREAMKAADL